MGHPEFTVIAGVELGGRLGERPPLMVGSLFYLGDSAVTDHSSGEFDRAEVKRRIEEDLQAAGRFALPFAFDPIAATPEAMRKYVEFLADFGRPIFIDSTIPKARIEGYKTAAELGIADRVVANSITTETPESELEAIKEAGVKAAVLLAFDPRDALRSLTDPEVKLKMLEGDLLPKAERAGIEAMLVDTAVLDPSSISLTAVTMEALRDKGFLVGCAPANALGALPSRIGWEEALCILTAALSFLRLKGADFLMYGPMGILSKVAAGVATAEALLARSLGLRVKIPSEHPFRKVMPILQEAFAKSSHKLG